MSGGLRRSQVGTLHVVIGTSARKRTAVRASCDGRQNR
jgi:hypothetical protein